MPPAMERSQRSQLVTWSGGFFLLIGVLLAAIGSIYLADYPWPGETLARIYTVVAFISHFAVLGIAPWLLLVLPLGLLVPSRPVVVGASILLTPSFSADPLELQFFGGLSTSGTKSPETVDVYVSQRSAAAMSL